MQVFLPPLTKFIPSSILSYSHSAHMPVVTYNAGAVLCIRGFSDKQNQVAGLLELMFYEGKMEKRQL